MKLTKTRARDVIGSHLMVVQDADEGWWITNTFWAVRPFIGQGVVSPYDLADVVGVGFSDPMEPRRWLEDGGRGVAYIESKQAPPDPESVSRMLLGGDLEGVVFKTPPCYSTTSWPLLTYTGDTICAILQSEHGDALVNYDYLRFATRTLDIEEGRAGRIGGAYELQSATADPDRITTAPVRVIVHGTIEGVLMPLRPGL